MCATMASATPPAGRRKLKPITLIPVTTPTRDAQKSSAQVSFFRDVIYSMRALFPMLYDRVWWRLSVATVPPCLPQTAHSFGWVRRFFQLFSYGMIAPIAPILLTNFFAKEPAGYDIQCQTFDPAEKPQACLSVGMVRGRWAMWRLAQHDNNTADACTPRLVPQAPSCLPLCLPVLRLLGCSQAP